MPLRIRVNMSATGSVFISLLPTRFRYPGDFTLQGQIPETDAAEPKFAEVTARATAEQTTIPLPDLVFEFFSQLRFLTGSCQSLQPPRPRPIRPGLTGLAPNGTPSNFSSAAASGSPLAVVTIVMFMPLIFSTRE